MGFLRGVMAACMVAVLWAMIPMRAAAAEAADTARRSSTRWIGQLLENNFNINDPSIDYPAFPRFCVKVYNWGDQTFNSYDTAYVVGTGKNWKLQGKQYSWLETQTMLFPKNTRINMHSDLYMDAGGYISFMAVSLGYMWDCNRLFNMRPSKRHTFNFDFVCSRFSLSLGQLTSEGGMTITEFGDYKAPSGKLRYRFDDIQISSFNADLYYFFNHRRYSHAAAYSYSKYQLRTQGTAIVGINFGNHDTRMDFSHLPPYLLQYLPLPDQKYRFHHKDYALAAGYGRNWVLKPRRWLLNLTALGAVGWKRTFDDATDGRRDMVANNYKVSFACVYNHRALFAAGTLRANGYLYYTSNFTHFNSVISMMLLVGMRF